MEPIKLRAHAQNQTTTADVDEVPDSYYNTRPPSSARRYYDTRGNQVIEQGNKRIVVHTKKPKNWTLPIGLGMVVMVLLFVGLNAFVNWWTNHQLDSTYEFPRVSQADAIVYPGDTADHPSHYLFLNLNGTVLIIELPNGDSTKSRIYKGPTLFTDNAASMPITGDFRVVNGKVEMLVHIQDRTILYVNDGTQFKPQQ